MTFFNQILSLLLMLGLLAQSPTVKISFKSHYLAPKTGLSEGGYSTALGQLFFEQVEAIQQDFVPEEWKGRIEQLVEELKELGPTFIPPFKGIYLIDSETLGLVHKEGRNYALVSLSRDGELSESKSIKKSALKTFDTILPIETKKAPTKVTNNQLKKRKEPKQKLDELILEIHKKNQTDPSGKTTQGIVLRDYPKKYGDFAVYYLIDDLVEKFNMSESLSPQSFPSKIKGLVGLTLKKGDLTRQSFFQVKKIVLEKKKKGDLEKLASLRGMVELASSTEFGAEGLNLGHFYSALGKRSRVEALLGEPLPEEVKWEWSSIQLPSATLSLLLKKLDAAKKESGGLQRLGSLRGMVELASSPEFGAEGLNLGQLYSALGKRSRVEALLGESLPEEVKWEWSRIDLPSATLSLLLKKLDAAKKESGGLQRLGSLRGMVELASSSEFGAEGLHLGQLYSALGQRFRVETFLGEPLSEEVKWEWSSIKLPSVTLSLLLKKLDAAKKESGGLQRLGSLRGMVELASSPEFGSEGLHLGHLYSALGKRSRVEALLGEPLPEEVKWEWSKINLPSVTLSLLLKKLDAAKTEAGGLQRLGSLRGMVELASSPEFGAEGLNLGSLYSALGKRSRVETLLGESLPEEVKWEWSKINLPSSTLSLLLKKLDAAKKESGGLQRLGSLRGMVELASSPEFGAEGLNLGQLYSALGKRSRVETLLGESLPEEVKWEWSKIDLPSVTLSLLLKKLDAAKKEVGGLQRLGSLRGMVELASSSEFGAEGLHLGQLYSALGKRSRVEALLGESLPEEVKWEWSKINLPSVTLSVLLKKLDAAKTEAGGLQRLGSLRGMVELASSSEFGAEGLHLGQLYSALGKRSRVEALLGESLPEEVKWEWSKIDLPSVTLSVLLKKLDAAKTEAGGLQRLGSLRGMVELASSSEFGAEGLHLGQLYSALGKRSRVEALLGESLPEEVKWEWSRIDLPSVTLSLLLKKLDAAKTEAGGLQRLGSLRGMVELASSPEFGAEGLHLGHLYSALGQRSRVETLLDEPLPEEVKWEWQCFSIPQQVVFQVHQKIKTSLKNFKALQTLIETVLAEQAITAPTTKRDVKRFYLKEKRFFQLFPEYQGKLEFPPYPEVARQTEEALRYQLGEENFSLGDREKFEPMESFTLKNYFFQLQSVLKKHVQEVEKSEELSLSEKRFLEKRLVFVNGLLKQMKKDSFGRTNHEVLDMFLGLDAPFWDRTFEEINSMPLVFKNKRVQRDQSQNFAVKLALLDEESDVMVVQGPPGNGKTATAAEMVHQFVTQGKKVLLSTETNRALDQMLSGLEDDFRRLGRTELSDASLQSKVVESSDQWDDFKERHKGVVLGSTHDKFFRTNWLDEELFDVVILDEASQSSLLKLLPIVFHGKKVILIGDPNQLSPYGMDNEVKELALSEAEKEAVAFFEASPLQRFQESGAFNWVMLSTHYRSHWAIGGLISTVFYEGRFASARAEEPYHGNVLRLEDTAKLSQNAAQRSEESFLVKGKPRLKNEFEVQQVVEQLKVYQRRQIDFSDVGVITFYKGQVEAIETELKKHFSDDQINQLSVATVDSYQGNEKKHLIVSFVRSNAEGNIGFLENPNRLNVALSRAKDELVLIGDFKMLTTETESNPASEIFQQIVDYIDDFKNGNGHHLNDHAQFQPSFEIAI